MINNKGNTHQALWVGLSSFSSFALSILSAAILSRYFDKEEYGTYKQILYVYNTLLIIFTAGLPRVFAYFLPRVSIEEGKDVVWKISKMLFLFGVIFSAALFFGSNSIAKVLNNPELALGLKYFSPIPMLLLPTLGIEGIFSSYKKTFYIAIYNTFSRLLMLIFIVLPVIIFKGSYLYAIYGWIVVSLITFVIAYFFKSIPFRGVNKKVSTLKMKEVFSYSLPLVGASIAGLAIRSADQFYISRYYGTEIFAEYSNGFMQIPFVAMITKATSTVLMPQFSKMVHEKVDVQNFIKLWERTLYKSAIIIYPIVVFLLFHAKTIIVLLYSETYIKSANYFQIAMVVNFFNIIVFAPLLFSLGETKFYSRIHVFGALLIWVGGYIFVNLSLGPIAFAVLSVSITVLLIILNMWKVSKVFNINVLNLVPLKSFFMIILHSILISILLYFLKNYLWGTINSLMGLILETILFVAFLILTSKIFRIDYLVVIKPILLKLNK